MIRLKRFYFEDNNIGGAQELGNTLRSHHRRVGEAKETGHVNSFYPIVPPKPEARGRRRVGGLHTTWAGGEDRCTDVPTPAQVSANRRARVLQQETTTASHVTNIYHMHRRIGTMYSRQERLKNPWDLSVHPAPKTGVRSNRNSVAASLCFWQPNNPHLPRNRLPRMEPVPEGLVADQAMSLGGRVASHVRSSHANPDGAGEGGRDRDNGQRPRRGGTRAQGREVDWGAVLAAQDIRAAGPEAAVLRLKQLVLEQIVAEQIYKQGELRELFDGLREFGREMRGSVESAMETALGELEVELDMRPSRRGEGMGGGAELRA